MGNGPTILKRKNAPIETTWNSESVFESWDTWQVELEDLLSQLSRFKEFEGELNSASVVAAWFELYYPFARRIGKLGTYTRMSAVVDTSDALAKGYLGQVSGLAAQFSAAHALSERVLSGSAEASENYLSFLSTGGSKYTMELFQLAGVDMSSPDPVERAFDVLAGLVDKLEQLTLTE